MNSLVSFLIGFASIAFMITIHETGHFIGARIAHIDVEVFAIGWGKAIKKWYRNGVEYRINIFILGGYCKLKGGEDLIEAVDKNYRSFTDSQKGSLFKAHPLKRIITYIGGPFVNLLFAFLLFIPFFMVNYYDSGAPPTILLTTDYPQIYPQPISSAKDSGFLSGDTIISIDGKEITYFSHISEVVNSSYNKSPLLVEVLRNNKIIKLALTPYHDKEMDRYIVGVTSAQIPIIGEVAPNTPEHIAGLAPGDTIIKVNGVEVNYTLDVINELIKSPSFVSMELVTSDGGKRALSYSPQKDNEGNVVSNIRYDANVVLFKGESFFKAIGLAFKETFRSIKETYRLFGQLITGKFSVSDSLAGPIRISYIIGQMSNSGARTFLQLLAMISISLGIANLLPLPGLDGGSVLLSIIELIRNKTFSPKLYLRFQMLGVGILGLLMLFVLFSDARFLFS